eukprot:3111826-Prymnesium_polylepis.1
MIVRADDIEKTPRETDSDTGTARPGGAGVGCPHGGYVAGVHTGGTEPRGPAPPPLRMLNFDF